MMITSPRFGTTIKIEIRRPSKDAPEPTKKHATDAALAIINELQRPKLLLDNNNSPIALDIASSGEGTLFTTSIEGQKDKEESLLTRWYAYIHTNTTPEQRADRCQEIRAAEKVVSNDDQLAQIGLSRPDTPTIFVQVPPKDAVEAAKQALRDGKPGDFTLTFHTK